MKNISVIIANFNERFLDHCLNHLIKGQDLSTFEILLIDDASTEPIMVSESDYPNLRIIKIPIQRGMGHAFDVGVSLAKYETIVLMGGDVMMKNSSWFNQALDYATNHPQGIACSCCLEGSPDYLDPTNPIPDSVKRYGAELLIYATGDELPKDSPSRINQPKAYVGLFDCKWIKRIPREPIIEVPIIYGACYVTNKTWYQHVNGWDTLPEKKMVGHHYFGGLEPWISLKYWLSGGECHVIRDMETLHIFHKFVTEDGVLLSNNGRGDYFWWNKFFIAFTMLRKAEAQRLMDKVMTMLIALELRVKNPSEGRRLIKYYMPYVLEIRERNKLLFTRDINWLCKKFGIRKDY